MLKELSTFTETLDSDFKNLNIRPKDGLNILLQVVFEDRLNSCRLEKVEYEIYSKQNKTEPLSDLLQRCAAIQEFAWTLDFEKKPFYQKCFDLPEKGILTVSPFSFATKKKSLIGGGKYNEKDKVKINNRVPRYIKKAKLLINPEFYKYAEWLQDYLSSWEEFERFLYSINGFDKLSEDAHVILHIDLPLDLYRDAYSNYLKDYLFNRKLPSVGEIEIGISNFFNGFNDDKPFLKHQTATFTFSGSVTRNFAESLFETQKILDRNILPRPLPIFIHSDELPKRNLRDDVFRLFKNEALKEPTKRKSHAEIITDLYKDHKDELGNYYLLYYQFGEIKDFDFVSRFEYHLWDDYNKRDWLEIKNIMGVASANKQPKVYPVLRDVFQVLNIVFTPLIGNKYLKIDNFFGKIDAKDVTV